MTPEEVVALQSMSDDERVAWLESKRNVLSTQDFVTLRGLGLGGAFSRQLDDPLMQAEARRSLPDRRAEERDMTEAAAAEALAAQESAYNAVIESGGTIAQATRAAEAASGTPATGDFILPQELVLQIGVDAKDEREAAEALDLLNSIHGRAFATWDDALESGLFASELERNVLASVLQQEDPEETFTVSTVKGQVTMSQGMAAQAMEVWGLRPHELAKTAKLAASIGFVNMNGEVAWQPAAAMFRAAGYAGYGDTDAEVNERNASQVRLAVEIQRAKDQLKTMNPGGEGGIALKRQINEMQARYDVLAKEYRDNVTSAPTSAKNPLWTPQYLRQQYQQGVEAYQGDDRLALIHVFDPALAQKLSASGGDVSKMDWRDGEKLASLTRAAGFTSLDQFAGTIQEMGYGEAGGFDVMSQLLKSLEAMRAGGGGRTVMKPDPVAIRQATKDMYRSLYLEDPTDDQLNAMAAKVESAIAGAPDDQSVDGNARVRDVVESDPKYQQFYGKKPGGMSEEEYQGMHRAAQGSMLGEELADNQAVRLGMQEGQYQTTVGAAAGTKEAWDNSTFLGRLARAAQTVGRNT